MKNSKKKTLIYNVVNDHVKDINVDVTFLDLNDMLYLLKPLVLLSFYSDVIISQIINLHYCLLKN